MYVANGGVALLYLLLEFGLGERIARTSAAHSDVSGHGDFLFFFYFCFVVVYWTSRSRWEGGLVAVSGWTS
jgi:hypothetical protein